MQYKTTSLTARGLDLIAAIHELRTGSPATHWRLAWAPTRAIP